MSFRSRLGSSFSRWAASPRGTAGAVLLGILLALPSLGVGLVHDDLLLRLALAVGPAGEPVAAHALYDFTTADPTRTSWLVEAGHMPWFTSPELSMRFFRPLSSLLYALDVALFGDAALPAHLHTLAWLVSFIVVVALLLREVVPPRAKNLAAAVFAVAGFHVMTSAWLAARHTLIGATFGALAIWAHVSWRGGGRRSLAVLAPLSLLTGLLASESTLGAVAGVVLYEALARDDAARARWVAAAPSLLIGLAHVTAYAAAGFGVHHSGTYITPFATPGAFIAALVTRLPVLLGELFGALPALLWGGAEPLRPVLAFWGIAWTGAALWLLVRAGRELAAAERRHLRWLMVWSVLALVPMVGGVPGGRLLPIASIGAAGVIGTVLASSWADRARGVRFAARALAALHFGLAPLVRIALALALQQASAVERRIAHEADLSACDDGDRAYLLTGADPVLSLFTPAAFHFYAPERVAGLSALRVLSMAPHDQEVRRGPDGSFELLVAAATRSANAFERVYRDRPLRPGESLRAGELEARVLAASTEGFPTHVRFELDGPLERVCFLVWDGARVTSHAPPPPGEVWRVPHHVGPGGM